MRKAEMDRAAEILLVEDNSADVRLMRQVFQLGKMNGRLHSVEDGEEAMEFLRREGEYAGAPRPDLILLDLNLPRMGGLEVLAEVKVDLDLKTIPVLVLTTSDSERDVLKSYQLHANCYMTKPARIEQFIDVVKTIEQFWMNTVVLPRKE